MASKRRGHTSSELDLTELTWEAVFQEADIRKDNPVAINVIRLDSQHYILRCFASGNVHEDIMKFLCQEEDFLQKVKSAVEVLLKDALVKRCRIEQNCPSPSELGKMEADMMPILDLVSDHRLPKPCPHDLHVSLQVEAFGEFIDVVSKEEVESKYLEVAGRVMQKMSDSYGSELLRQTAFFDEVAGIYPENVSDERQQAKSNATMKVKINGHEYKLANWEFKNEMKDLSSEPNVQNIGHFIHLQSGSGFLRTPMLLITVVGCHYLQVFGAAWNGAGRISVDPLCSPVSLLFVSCDPMGGVEKTARVFAAIDAALRKLKEHYQTSEEERIKSSKGPYFRDCNLGELTYVDNTPENKWLYDATTVGGEHVVVKFVRYRYGEDVHRYLNEKGLAPKLHQVVTLPGNWRAVIMEKVDGEQLAEEDLKVVSPKLLELRTALNDRKFVHGDLRCQNIMVSSDKKKVTVVDFDWAGVSGSATYPKEINLSSECKWHKDVKCGGVIYCEHDDHQLKLLGLKLADFAS